MSSVMTSNRPYMLRAFYEWIVDNNCTPHLVVNAEYPDTVVPQQFVQDGQIVLNISPTATGNMLMSNDLITFNARFGGQPMQLSIPYPAVLGIYARENGAGTIFHGDDVDPVAAEEDADQQAQTNHTQEPKSESEPESKPATKKGSHLKVVK
jgi:stringent starvation protein B